MSDGQEPLERAQGNMGEKNSFENSAKDDIIQDIDDNARGSESPIGCDGVCNLDKEDDNFVSIPITKLIRLAALKAGQDPKAWVRHTIESQAQSVSMMTYRKGIGEGNSLAVSARVTKPTEAFLKACASDHGASMSLLASSLVERFLAAHDDIPSDLVLFEGPPAGRVRSKDKEKVEQIRRNTSRLQLR